MGHNLDSSVESCVTSSPQSVTSRVQGTDLASCTCRHSCWDSPWSPKVAQIHSTTDCQCCYHWIPSSSPCPTCSSQSFGEFQCIGLMKLIYYVNKTKQNGLWYYMALHLHHRNTMIFHWCYAHNKKSFSMELLIFLLLSPNLYLTRLVQRWYWKIAIK